MKPLLLSLIVAAALVVAIVAFVLSRDGGPVDECTPDGGIRCDGRNIAVCQGGKLVVAGACEGGCTSDGTSTRCLNADGSLVAPLGAACSRGVGMCGLEPGSLLVCREGALAKAAICPKGCLDEGGGGALFCMDERGGIRFAEGFGCPRFGGKMDGLACDVDGKRLLACQGEVLAPHTVTCDICVQQRTGPVSCLNEAGDRLNPRTGEVLPLLDEPPAPAMSLPPPPQ